MSLGAACGLWSTRRGLVAAVVEADGAVLFTDRLGDDPDQCVAWLSRAEYRYGPGLELVVTEDTARDQPLARHALELGHRVWTVQRAFVLPICRAAWWRPAPRQIAAMLARFPRVAQLRLALRLQPPDPGPHQLRLFRSG